MYAFSCPPGTVSSLARAGARCRALRGWATGRSPGHARILAFMADVNPFLRISTFSRADIHQIAI